MTAKEQETSVMEVRRVNNNPDIFYLQFSNPENIYFAPGQFLKLAPKAPGSILGRPFSVYNVNEKFITVLIKIVGPNTGSYSELQPGNKIKMLGPLGKPIPIDPEAKHYILVAGGMGAPALTRFSRALKQAGKDVKVLLGGQDKTQIICAPDFRAYGCITRIITEKGGGTNNGLVTDLLADELRGNVDNPIVVACGLLAMLKEVAKIARQNNNQCLVVLERHMACGLGSCKSCAVFVRVNGQEKVQHVCQDGPAFDAALINWGKIIPSYQSPAAPVTLTTADTNPLSVTLVGQNGKQLTLAYPWMNASGCLSAETANEQKNVNRAGTVVTKGVGLLPCLGNPAPRTCETASGMLNAIGLENIGLEASLSKELSLWLALGKPVVVNIFGNSIEEFRKIALALAKTDITALEVNVSCPNIHANGMNFGQSPESTFEVTQTVCMAAPNKFIIVKLAPLVTDITVIAKAAEEAGADALTVANTYQGLAIDIETQTPKLANLSGGLSGPAIKPITLYLVYRTVKAVKIPIIGLGGITDYRDVLEYIITGATAVGIGTGLLINPCVMQNLEAEILKFLKRKGLNSIRELIGSLKKPLP